MALTEQEQNQRYRSTHREHERARHRNYHSTHKEEIHERKRQYNLTHKEKIREQNEHYRMELRQQFLEGIYGDACFFCKKKVLAKDLARHHINGDGSEERARLGGGVTGFIRSWRKAIEEADPTKWATSHMSCHSRFHTKERRRQCREHS